MSQKSKSSIRLLFRAVCPLALILCTPSLLVAVSAATSLRGAHSPVWIGQPPTDAIAGLVLLPTGEISYYDCDDQVDVHLYHRPGHLPATAEIEP